MYGYILVFSTLRDPLGTFGVWVGCTYPKLGDFTPRPLLIGQAWLHPSHFPLNLT